MVSWGLCALRSFLASLSVQVVKNWYYNLVGPMWSFWEFQQKCWVTSFVPKKEFSRVGLLYKKKLVKYGILMLVFLPRVCSTNSFELKSHGSLLWHLKIGPTLNSKPMSFIKSKLINLKTWQLKTLDPTLKPTSFTF